MKKNLLLISILSLGFMSGQVGTTCSNPIVISSLPYTTIDNTANYADNYDPDTSNSPSCSGIDGNLGNYYHGGNDVIYSYTATTNGTIKIEIPDVAAWTGLFVYTSCDNIGLNYAACRGNVPFITPTTMTLDNFAVTAGQTYYILISSWPESSTISTISYTLNVTSPTLAVNDTGTAKKQTSVYPNPTGKDLNFQSQKDIISATLYTMEGRKINTSTVKNNTISVESLSAGSYIVEFNDQSGNTFTKVFIKK